MALSAADFQKAFTVDVPVGDIISKGVTQLQEQEAERERKRLQNIEYFYKQYDPLLIGTGTPDDPYITKQLQDIESQVMNLPLKKMSQSQFTSTVRGMLASVKARREQAKQFAATIEQEAKALHEQDPTIKEEALVREAKKRAFFDWDNKPVTSFDFNRNHAATVFEENPLAYVDIDAAGGLFNKETKNKLIQETNVPSQYDPNTKFDITRTIYQRPVLNKDGSAALETAYQPIKVSKNVTLKALPEEQFNALINSPGGKWLIQNELQKYKQVPELKDVDNEVLLHAAAYDVANNKVDRSETQINSKNEPKVGRGTGDGSGGGGGPKAVAQDTAPVNNLIEAALGNKFPLSKLKPAQGDLGQKGYLNGNTLFPNGKIVVGYRKTKKPNFNNAGMIEEVEEPVYGNAFVNPKTNEISVYRPMKDEKGNEKSVLMKTYNVATSEGSNNFYDDIGLYNGKTALEGTYDRDIHQSPGIQNQIINNALSKKQLDQQIEKLGQDLGTIIAPQKRLNFDFNLFSNKPSNSF